MYRRRRVVVCRAADAIYVRPAYMNRRGCRVSRFARYRCLPRSRRGQVRILYPLAVNLTKFSTSAEIRRAFFLARGQRFLMIVRDPGAREKVGLEGDVILGVDGIVMIDGALDRADRHTRILRDLMRKLQG